MYCLATVVSVAQQFLHGAYATTCRTEAEKILSTVNPNGRGTGQGEARHRKNKRLKLDGSQDYAPLAD
jgi:hypothetical protein